MANPFQLNAGESILYHSQPSHKWYEITWKIGLGIFEVFIFVLLSITSFASLSSSLLATFLPMVLAFGLSRIIFQGIVPFLVAAWFAEDTARFFTSELILTSLRMWTKGSPYAWTSERETPLDDIKSMSFRRDTLFIHLKNTRKTQLHVFSDGKMIVKAFVQFTGKNDGI